MVLKQILQVVINIILYYGAYFKNNGDEFYCEYCDGPAYFSTLEYYSYNINIWCDM